MAPHMIDTGFIESNIPALQSSRLPGVARERDVLEAIAIVGMSVEFPQDIKSPETLWDAIMTKRNTTTDIPISRMAGADLYHPDRDRRGQISVKRGHFLNRDLAAFDAQFFNASAVETAAIDPQQRLLLEQTYLALENAGIPKEQVAGSRTSVYTGSFCYDWRDMMYADGEESAPTAALGAGPNLNANRISWFFDLRGSSVNIDTACSSSLVCLDMGCQDLRLGNEDMSIVAGANVMLSPNALHSLTNMNMVSNDGECYSFDHRGNGYGRGEGVGVLVLKRVADAIRDGNTIRGIIRSSGCNQDGKTTSISLPNGISQADLIRRCYNQAGLSMDPVRFFESHGTGTAAGDPIEADAFGSVFRQARSSEDPLWIGAVKSNIGHLEGCSGIAGVVKAALVLEKAVIPPNNNFEILNNRIDAEFFHLRFPTNPIPWPAQGLRRASVNSFGNGGTNAHVVLDDVFHYLQERGLSGNHITARIPPSINLQEPDRLKDRVVETDALLNTEFAPRLLVLSAADESGIERQARRYATHFSSTPKLFLASSKYLDNLVHTLAVRRSRLAWRSFAVVKSVQDMQNLDRIVSKPKSTSVETPGFCFVFTGQGAQWAGMGRELLSEPVFSQTLIYLQKHLFGIGCRLHLIEELLREEDSRIDLPELSQPLCTAIQIGLVDLLRSYGVCPTVVIGHSSGEIAAAYCIGALSKTSALEVAYYRGKLAGELAERQDLQMGMMSVGLSEAGILPYLGQVAAALGVSLPLTVACINSPTNVTVSGEASQLDALQDSLTLDKVFHRRLAVNVAYHSPYMESITDSYRRSMGRLRPGPEPTNRTTMYSTVTGERINTVDLSCPQYWVRNMVSPVKFVSAVTSLISDRAPRIKKKLDLSHRRLLCMNLFIEVGPHAALQRPVRDTLAEIPATADIGYASCLLRKANAAASFLSVVGQLYCLGYELRLANPQKNLGRDPLVTLPDVPGYAFNHSKQYWYESRISSQYRNSRQARLDLLGKPVVDWNPYEPRWRNHLRVSEMPWIEHHVINGSVIYPGAGMVVMAIEAMNQLADNVDRIEVRDVRFVRPLQIFDGVETQVSLRRESNVDLSWYKFSVYSFEQGSWEERCYGLVRPRFQEVETLADNVLEKQRYLDACNAFFAKARSTCDVSIEPDILYTGFVSIGIGLGKPFHRLKNGKFDTQGRVLANLELYQWPDNEYPQNHIIHPITLDGILHGAMAGFMEGGHRDIGTMVPTYLGYLSVSCKDLICKGPGNMHECSQLSKETARTAVYDGFAMNCDRTEVIVEFRTLETTRIAESQTREVSADPESNQNTFEVRYLTDVDHLSPQQIITLSDEIPSSGSSLKFWMDLLCHKDPALRILDVNIQDYIVGQDLLSYLSIPHGDGRTSHPLYGEYCYMSDSEDRLARARKALGSFDSVKIESIAELLSSNTHEKGGGYDVILIDSALFSRDELISRVGQVIKPDGKLVVATTTETAADELVLSTLAGHSCRESHLVLSDNGRRFKVYQLEAKKAMAETRSVILVRDAASIKQQLFCERFADFARSKDLQVSLLGLDKASRSVGKDCIYVVVLELDNPFLYTLSAEEFAHWNSLLLTATDVIWVNYQGGSTAPGPEYAMVHGVLRTLANEREDLRTTILALEEHQDGPSTAQVCKVLGIVDDHADSTDTRETEYIEVNGVLVIPRIYPAGLVKDDQSTEASLMVTREQRIKDVPPMRLSIDSVGFIDTLHFVEDETMKRAMAEDEVEVKVRAIGVNDVDYSTAMGQTPYRSFGRECAGTVTRSGSKSGFATGDRVAVIGTGLFGHIARVKARCVIKIADEMPFTSVAAIMGQFGIAWEIVHNIARLRQGDSILVDVATDSTYMAIIQLTISIGVDVFATVESERMKQILIDEYGIPSSRTFYSRNANLAKIINHLTHDQGVSVIISDESKLECCECLAPYGQLIHLDRQEIRDNVVLPNGFNKKWTFTTLDASQFQIDRPHVMVANVCKALDKIADGSLKVPSPLRVKDISEFRDAFELFSAERDEGKTVLEVTDESQVAVCTSKTRPTLELESQASYLIAGGLGGLGRAIARWMVDRGARNLILLSRRGPRTEEALQFITELRERGARVETPACDISDLARLQHVVDSLQTQMPPIKGCLQASMLERDRLFQGLEFDEWDEAVKCKTVGSWNLHATLPVGLDFFILLSSGAGLCGLRGQTNYNAGNCYEDALARFRVAQGERATSLDLGAMRDDGQLVERPEVMQRLLNYGALRPVSRRSLRALLDYYCDPTRSGGTSNRMQESQAAIGLGFGDSHHDDGDAANTLEAGYFLRQPMMAPLRVMGKRLSERNATTAAAAAAADTIMKSSATAVAAAVRPRVRFAAANSREEGAAVVAEAIVRKLGRSLMGLTDEAVINGHTALQIYGVDSLLAVELRNWLAKEFEAEVAIFETQGASTLNSLSFLIATRSAIEHGKWEGAC